MKQLSLFGFAVSFLVSSLSLAYTTMIKNSTDADIKVYITYAAAAICGPSVLLLKAGEIVGENEKACCTWLATFTGKSKDLYGKEVIYEPSLTGAQTSCKSWAAEIKRFGDRSDFEVVKWEPKEWFIGTRPAKK